MPIVPQFDNDVAVRPVPMPTADASAFGKVGQAAAQGFGQLSDQMAEFNQRHAEAQRGVATSDTAVANKNSMNELGTKWSKVENLQQALTGFDTDVAKLRSTSLDAIKDPYEKAAVTEHFNADYAFARADVSRSAFARESGKVNGDGDLQLDSLAHDYAQAGSDLERARIIDLATTAIKTREAGGYIDGDTAAAKLIHFRSRADAADATRDIDANPVAALGKLNDEESYPHLDELTRGRLIGRAESKVQSGEATVRGTLRARYADNVASIEATGEPVSALSPNDIRAAFPEQEADEMVRRLDLAQGVYQARNAVTLTSPDQDKALLDKWQPRGVGFADQSTARELIGKTVDAKWKAIDADPAGYVLSAAPEIAAQFGQAQNDPSKMKTAFASLDAAYDKLGMPSDARPLFTPEAAQNFSQSIMKNPSQAPAMLKTLEKQAGNYWPRMFRDLVTVGKLPPTYQAVATLDNDRDGALLSRWLGELPSGKVAGDLVGTKVEHGIKADVRSNPDVQSFISSLSRSGSSSSQVENVLGAIDALAFAKSFYDHDPQAAQHAADAFTSKYEFMPAGGARVPRANFEAVSANAANLLTRLRLPPSFDSAHATGMLKAGNLDPWDRPILHNPDGSYSTTSSISIGTDNGETLIPTVVNGRRLSKDEAIAHYKKTGENLGTFDTAGNADRFATALHNAQAGLYDERGNSLGLSVAVPAIYGKPGMPKPEEYLDQLKAAPSWITSPNTDALLLMDAQGRLVRDKSGQPLRVPFNAPATPQKSVVGRVLDVVRDWGVP